MPLTTSGKKVLSGMTKQYGAKKGKAVFYASIQAKKKGSSDWHEASGNDRLKALKKLKQSMR